MICSRLLTVFYDTHTALQITTLLTILLWYSPRGYGCMHTRELSACTHASLENYCRDPPPMWDTLKVNNLQWTAHQSQPSPWSQHFCRQRTSSREIYAHAHTHDTLPAGACTHASLELLQRSSADVRYAQSEQLAVNCTPIAAISVVTAFLQTAHVFPRDLCACAHTEYI